MAEPQATPLNDGSTPHPTPDGASAVPKPDAQASPVQPTAAPQAGPGEGWVPSYRLREVSERAERTERAFAELQNRLTQQDERIKQVFGVQQPDPKREAIRQEFLSYFPEYQSLQRLAEWVGDRDPAQVFNGLVQSREEGQLAVAHQMYDAIDTKMADAYGDKPPQFARDAAYAAFVTWLGSHPEYETRFARHDTSLATEFWNLYSSGVLEPHRQHFTAAEQTRRAAAARLPRGGASSADIVPGDRKKKAYKDLDEASDAAFDMLREQQGR